MNDCEFCDEPEGAVAKRSDGVTACDGCHTATDPAFDSAALEAAADEAAFYDN